MSMNFGTIQYGPDGKISKSDGGVATGRAGYLRQIVALFNDGINSKGADLAAIADSLGTDASDPVKLQELTTTQGEYNQLISAAGYMGKQGKEAGENVMRNG